MCATCRLQVCVRDGAQRVSLRDVELCTSTRFARGWMCGGTRERGPLLILSLPTCACNDFHPHPNVDSTTMLMVSCISHTSSHTIPHHSSSLAFAPRWLLRSLGIAEPEFVCCSLRERFCQLPLSNGVPRMEPGYLKSRADIRSELTMNLISGRLCRCF